MLSVTSRRIFATISPPHSRPLKTPLDNASFRMRNMQSTCFSTRPSSNLFLGEDSESEESQADFSAAPPDPVYLHRQGHHYIIKHRDHIEINHSKWRNKNIESC